MLLKFSSKRELLLFPDISVCFFLSSKWCPSTLLYITFCLGCYGVRFLESSFWFCYRGWSFPFHHYPPDDTAFLSFWVWRCHYVYAFPCKVLLFLKMIRFMSSFWNLSQDFTKKRLIQYTYYILPITLYIHTHTVYPSRAIILSCVGILFIIIVGNTHI